MVDHSRPPSILLDHGRLAFDALCPIDLAVLAWTLRPVSTSANSAARPSDGLSGHAQLEIQAESERLLANARSVLEVESSSTFSRPE